LTAAAERVLRCRLGDVALQTLPYAETTVEEADTLDALLALLNR
jgi:hypothetical protein